MNTPTLHKILYVEDEPDIQTIARLALQEVGGFDLCLCSNGAEALALADDYRPDLLILDVMLPGMDGPATLAELRKKPALATTPALFMTAKVQPQELEQLRAQGVVGVITKPFDPMTLAGTVRDIWHKI
ncbi:response regulator [Thiohalophilus sp.]|uniref:response regulator n=1 Tax=Thiohalophilus sp. TaxID=3028392 RepID=UPI002ACE3502|nr:response regulator [Thiohalophilus sp.]MDZ7660898.1 response regulator [Thiohalophilus sp.]